MSELIARVAAAQATLDGIKDRTFRLGHMDCVRMTASHLRAMGHKVRLPPKGSYGSPRSALRALRARGYDDVLVAMDDFGFERIAPARALVADVLALPTASPLGCLLVVQGNGRACGFLDDVAVGAVLQPVEYVAAWRVPCLRAAGPR